MKRSELRQVSVEIAPESEEAVVELLGNLFRNAASVYHDLEAGRTTATVYCERPSEWSPRKRKELREGLSRISKCGLDIGPATIRTRMVKREDWAESWKRHFKPLDIGGALLIKPSWSRRKSLKGQAEILLDPGLSFGTGQHPTTAFCLRELVAARNKERRQSFLDIGTGSGILAIAAAKLGYAPVHAFDFDPESVRVSKENIEVNGVAGQIQLQRKDITKAPFDSARKFDVICANLIDDLLISERRRIINRLRPGGVLILAGILNIQFEAVKNAFSAEGLRLANSFIEGEWRSGTFSLPEKPGIP